MENKNKKKNLKCLCFLSCAAAAQQDRAASCARPPPAGGGAGCTCQEQPAAGDFGGSFGAGKATFAIWKLPRSRKHSRKSRAVPTARQTRMRLVGAGGSSAAPGCPPVPRGGEPAPGSGSTAGLSAWKLPRGTGGCSTPGMKAELTPSWLWQRGTARASSC